MLDIYKTITNAMQEREDKYISFPDLVDYLRSVNNGDVQNSAIGDYLLFRFKRFNPNEFGDKADFFPIYISMDLSDVTRELEVSYDQDLFFKFAYSLCDGSFSNKDYWYFFVERNFVFNEINIDQETAENQTEPVVDLNKLQEEKAPNAQLQEEIERLKAENAELKAQLQDNAQRQSAVDSEPVLENAKATRISKIQRDIFTLLVLKNYQGLESRNALFDVINADLKEQGINNKGASYQTFDNLIDENIRLTKTSLDGKQASHSPFPIKITK